MAAMTPKDILRTFAPANKNDRAAEVVTVKGVTYTVPRSRSRITVTPRNEVRSPPPERRVRSPKPEKKAAPENKTEAHRFARVAAAARGLPKGDAERLLCRGACGGAR